VDTIKLMVRPEHVLDSWKSVRQDTIAAVQEFPPSEFDFRPAPDLMTFRETATHILHAGHGLSGMLLAGQDNFAAPDFRERIKEQNASLSAHSAQAELAAALRESVEQRAAQLAAQSPEFFAQIITRMDGQKVTRLEMLQMIKEHELTHRAHLFVCLRMKGLTPATTRRRAAQQAKG
jgi:uncharacterized damage-inducible protein DinB